MAASITPMTNGATSLGVSPTAAYAAAYQPGAHYAPLDGLRGSAIIAVLLYHFGVGTTFVGFQTNPVLDVMIAGWAGVDLFFVLSGFLITGILYDSKRDPHYFRNFYMRRTLRIFPIYFLCIALVWVAVQLLSPLNTTQNDGFIYPLTFTTNLAVAFTADWYTIPVIIGHYWSLAIEEQFYLIWPAVVLFTPHRWLLRVTMLLVVGAFGLRVGMTLAGIDPNVIFALTLTRCDALAAGAFVALAMREPEQIKGLFKWAPFVFGGAVAALAIAIAMAGRMVEYDGWIQTLGFSALCIGSAALLVLTFASTSVGKIFSSASLRWFGRYSYGIYIWHYPIYFVCFEIDSLRRLLGVQVDWTGLVFVTAALGCSIFCGVCSYHLIEKPFLDLKQRFAPASA